MSILVFLFCDLHRYFSGSVHSNRRLRKLVRASKQILPLWLRIPKFANFSSGSTSIAGLSRKQCSSASGCPCSSMPLSVSSPSECRNDCRNCAAPIRSRKSGFSNWLRDRLGSWCGRLKSGSWKRRFWNFDQSAARAEREQTQNPTSQRREALLLS